jgi:lysophospholipase L1-like esterase
MKQLFIILFFFTCSSSSCDKKDIGNTMTVDPIVAGKYYYLALGDSYTIGESVPSAENFPNQVVSSMLQNAIAFYPARIIAKTGWTTDELEAGITAANTTEPLRSSYDFVSLLIGVNNQYRGRTVDSYKPEFEALLKKAILFAGNKADHVVVLSIPDWGVTPFATGRNRAQIAAEMDNYNAANKEIALQYNVHYIDITPWTREAATNASLLAPDGLHPSGIEYKRWAESLVKFFRSRL